MTLRLTYEELENRGFDAGGGEILYYQGVPFTGTVVAYYENGRPLTEEEFQDGHLGGAQREYHENGQLGEEYFIAFNTPYGMYKKWDKNGNLIKEFSFVPKP
jgi:antitoxin component YwqK of YwqJK toxin-antitoxin module